MRIGTTSYIYPADIETNVMSLAGKVRDVELLLFECDEDGRELPDHRTVEFLIQTGRRHEMTFTVHLPLDLALAGDSPSLDRAALAVAKTLSLAPVGFIAHLDGAKGECLSRSRWVYNSLRSLDFLSEKAGSAQAICVENLDDQPLEFVDSILSSTPVSCCFDVGHVWKCGLDPLPWLERWRDRIEVVHLHGIGTRDHQSLSLVPAAQLDAVTGYLVSHFDGVATIEVFSERDLMDSLAALEGSIGRISGRT
jgi:sugar phosphate isomerase/epimerase